MVALESAINARTERLWRDEHAGLVELVEVSVDVSVVEACAVKLQSDAWELNVRASRDELASLAGIRGADWQTRSTIAAGRSAGAPAFWSADGGTATVLIGDDDEVWDIAVSMPVEVIDTIVALAAEVRS